MTTISTSVNIEEEAVAPVTLSDTATTKVAELLGQEEGDNLALRVAVKPGGCSGYSYEMFFDTEFMSDDVISRFWRGQGRCRCRQRGTPYRFDSRLQRRSPGRGLPHQQSQRDPHVRVRLVLQLSRGASAQPAP